MCGYFEITACQALKPSEDQCGTLPPQTRHIHYMIYFGERSYPLLYIT